jgi:hypothetical protein
MAKRSGYFLVYRDIWRNPVFKNLLQASCWIYFISSASHQDKTLRFLDNEIFVRRGEMIMPLRVTAKRFGMTYSEIRAYILRLVRRKMVTTRTAHLQPTNNHKSRKVTLISLVNYDKYQFIEDKQPHTNHLQQEVLINKKQLTNLNSVIEKSSKDKGDKIIGTEGMYNILLRDGKKYLKHKFKDEPIKEY